MVFGLTPRLDSDATELDVEQLPTDHLTWEQAEALCASLAPSGHLASMHSEREVKAVTEYMKSLFPTDKDCRRAWKEEGISGNVWIGARETYYGEYEWMNGLRVIFPNWAKGQPASWQSHLLGCVYMSCLGQFGWYKMFCNVAANPTSALCEADHDEPPPPTECPDGYELIGEGCYAFAKMKREAWSTWEDGQEFCAESVFGGKLATLNTQDDVERVTEYLLSMYPDNHACKKALDEESE